MRPFFSDRDIVPLLKKEIDLFPPGLLEHDLTPGGNWGARWWALYTLPRREKLLMRKLAPLGIPFYGPVIERRLRGAGGRVRSSFLPLFSNYVFVHADEGQRQSALTTQCVSRCVEVSDGKQLAGDLRAIWRLIQTGRPLSPEGRLVEGDRVRVKTGVFAGFEGIVIRRDRETRLIVAVNFAQQGASVQLDDCQLEPL